MLLFQISYYIIKKIKKITYVGPFVYQSCSNKYKKKTLKNQLWWWFIFKWSVRIINITFIQWSIYVLFVCIFFHRILFILCIKGCRRCPVWFSDRCWYLRWLFDGSWTWCSKFLWCWKRLDVWIKKEYLFFLSND